VDDLAAFYRLHVDTRRRLGVPVQPRRFMQHLFREMVANGLGFVIFACQRDRPIAAALFLAWNRQLIYKFAASDHRYWALRPNNLVLWAGIEWGYGRGYRALDLGRTDAQDQGLRYFKSRWGATETPLTYSYLTGAPGPAPKLAMRAMAKLIQWSPAIVCRTLGELLYRRAALSAA
jgi:CelD/BcsL family acetyltransferase involved in cellulose biosynthesis